MTHASTEMELRVTKAILEANTEIDGPVISHHTAMLFARAAMSAQYEPTEAMLDAVPTEHLYGGIQGHRKWEHKASREIYQAMFDAALSSPLGKTPQPE